MKRRVFNFVIGAAAALSSVLCIVALALWVRTAFAQDVLMRTGFAAQSGRMTYFVVRPARGRVNVVYLWRDLYPEAQAQFRDVSTLTGRWRYARADAHDPLSDAFDGRWVQWRARATTAGPGREYVVALHLGLIVAATAVLSAWWLRRWNLLPRRAKGLCPSCGYDLRATPERCPECGAVSPVAAQATQLSRCT